MLSNSRRRVTAEIRYVNQLLNSKHQAVILTNDPLLINKRYLSNEDTNNIYLFNFKERKFQLIRSLLDHKISLDLRDVGYALPTLWMNRGFPDAVDNIE